MKWKILIAACLIFSTPGIADQFSTPPTPAQQGATDCSGTIAYGNTPQEIIPAGTSLTTEMLQNIDPQEALWFSTSTIAAQNMPGSFVLPPCRAGSFSRDCLIIIPHPASITAGKLTVVAQTPGHRYSCAYWP